MIAPGAGSARAAACASPARRKGWISTTCCWAARPASRRARNERRHERNRHAENQVAAAIDAAEDIPDPLEGLVEKTAADPGAAFAPEVLERLAALKKEDRAAFEALRAQLKKAGCRVTALDEAIAEENGEAGGRSPNQADILIDLAQIGRTVPRARTELASPISTSMATGRPGLSAARASGAGWRAASSRRRQGAPSSEALQSALNVIEAKAHFDAPERAVHVRVGGLDGRLYLDLCDETWRAVEIDATGWRVIDNPPVRFRRAAGMQPLPMPVAGGSVETLHSFLNVQSDNDFVLVVAWALASAQSRSLPGNGFVGRTGIGEVHFLGDPAGAARSQHRALARPAARGPRPVHRRQQRPCTGLRQRVGFAGLDFRHALSPRDRRRLCGAPALHRPGRGAVRRGAAGDPQRHRGHRDAARPCRPRRVPDAGTNPGRTPPARGRNCGPRSRPNARASLACCSTLWWRASSSCPRPGSRSCRGWPTSRCGRPLARRRSGPPALSGRPIAAIAMRRWRA